MDALTSTAEPVHADLSTEAQSGVADDWSWWREALAAGRGVDTERGNPRSGYYRVRDEAWAFWREADETVCWRSETKYPTPNKPDTVDEAFGWAAPHPISFEDFTHFQDNGRWPEQIDPIEAPSEGVTPDQAIADELIKRQEQAKKWFTVLADRKANTQAEADKAKNYENEFADIAKRAEAARKAEKEPILQQGRDIDAKFNPTVEAAGKAKDWAFKIRDAYQKEETARRVAVAKAETERLQREYDEARAKQQAELTEKGVQVPEFAPPPVEPPKPAVAAPVMVGTSGRRAGVSNRKSWEIESPKLVLEFMALRNEHGDTFLTALKTAARALISAGVTVPGMKEMAQ